MILEHSLIDMPGHSDSCIRFQRKAIAEMKFCCNPIPFASTQNRIYMLEEGRGMVGMTNGSYPVIVLEWSDVTHEMLTACLLSVGSL